MDRRKFMAGCLGLPLLAQTGEAQAQAGLSKIIFPFAAGAGGDTLCRLIAQEMAPVLQRTMVVENRTGGDGLIGIKAVKGASPDGSMVLVTTGPTMYLLPMVETTPSFDSSKDFMPVSLLARFEFALVINPAVDATDFKSLWRGSRRIRTRPRSGCRATAPFHISWAPSSRRISAFP